jgi:hypothetical protein
MSSIDETARAIRVECLATGYHSAQVLRASNTWTRFFLEITWLTYTDLSSSLSMMSINKHTIV